jgi:hypothetical protein
VGSKKYWSIWVKPEDETRWVYTGSSFKSKKRASTFYGIEGIAGMGESYMMKRIKRRR